MSTGSAQFQIPSSFKSKSFGAQGRGLSLNGGNLCWLTDWIEELLGPSGAEQPCPLREPGSGHGGLVHPQLGRTQRILPEGTSQLEGAGADRVSLCKTGQRLRQEGNWIFPSSKREGCPRRRQEEKGREAEIDLRLEINILNQKIAVVLCFNNLMGKNTQH